MLTCTHCCRQGAGAYPGSIIYMSSSKMATIVVHKLYKMENLEIDCKAVDQCIEASFNNWCKELSVHAASH